MRNCIYHHLWKKPKITKPCVNVRVYIHHTTDVFFFFFPALMIKTKGTIAAGKHPSSADRCITTHMNVNVCIAG